MRFPFFLKTALAALMAIALISGFVQKEKAKPTLYIIGDSTVRNTHQPQAGWGSFIGGLLDTTRIKVSNQAGARINAALVAEGLKQHKKHPLTKYVARRKKRV
jgi:rhamnogalacturonan acetylesterase